MIVEIDENSGFCFGVVKAISKVEEELKTGDLYCLGDIVHNHLEVERLEKLGLKTINYDEFKDMHNCKVIFRAHGEAPSSYKLAIENNVEVIDASCPVVLNLQKKIREAYDLCKSNGGKVVIYGKKGHAEVVGLVGQTEGNAIVVEKIEDIDAVDCSKPVILFSQTTKSLDSFMRIASALKARGGEKIIVHDTICRKVANRIPQLLDFISKHDTILFVSGRKSSNGKQLFEVCKKANENSYFVCDENDVTDDMLRNVSSIGISGATSTPRWIMERIKEKILAYNN